MIKYSLYLLSNNANKNFAFIRWFETREKKTNEKWNKKISRVLRIKVYYICMCMYISTERYIPAVIFAHKIRLNQCHVCKRKYSIKIVATAYVQHNLACLVA